MKDVSNCVFFLRKNKIQRFQKLPNANDQYININMTITSAKVTVFAALLYRLPLFC